MTGKPLQKQQKKNNKKKNNKKKIQGQKGGGTMGEGAYGCVVSPPIRCMEEPGVPRKVYGKDMVGKVFLKTRHLEAERQVIDKIAARVDPEGLFTLSVQGSCFVDREDLSGEKCKMYEHAIAENRTQLPQLIFHNAGVDLDVFVRNLNKYNVSLEAVLPCFLPIFQGLVTLGKHSVMHFDIKPPNIMYDPARSRMFLGDFGVAIQMKDAYIYGDIATACHSYKWYPPELMLFCSLTSGERNLESYLLRLKHRQTSTFINDGIRDSRKPFLNEVHLRWHADLSAMHTRYKGMTQKEDLQKAFVAFAAKLDVYGLAATLLFVVKSMELAGHVRHKPTYAAAVEFAVRCMRFDPARRPSPTVALAAFKKLLAGGEFQPSAPTPPPPVRHSSTVSIKDFVLNLLHYEMPLEAVLPCFLPVLQDLVSLGKRSYVNLEISPPNVMFDMATSRMFLQDGGLAKRDAVYANGKTDTCISSKWFPPELMLFCSLSAGERDLESYILRMKYQDVESIQIVNDGIGDNRKPFLNEAYLRWHADLDAMHARSVKNVTRLEKAFEPFAAKLDLYGLAATILFVIKSMEFAGYVRHKPNYAAAVEFAVRCMRFDPQLRPSPAAALVAFKKLLAGLTA
jgi:serine/threonine protein kinase